MARLKIGACLKLIAESAAHFFYPSFCFHCQNEVHKRAFLCEYCLDQLEFLTPHSRCMSCFQQREEHRCKECSDLFVNYRTASVFSYEGPIKSLLHSYKFNKMSGLSKLFASFMAVQWQKIGGDTPDYIVPVPQSWLKCWERGFYPTHLLAKELSMIFKIPVIKKLSRKAESYSQSQLNMEMRKQFDSSTLILNIKPVIAGKRVLLIDDVITTGRTIFECTALLEEEGPLAIDVLSLALTE